MCLNFPDFRNTLISKYARFTLETEIFDGECFIGMDLEDINGLTAKLKLRKLHLETSKASVDRSYGNGNYVGSLRLLKRIIRKRG